MKFSAYQGFLSQIKSRFNLILALVIGLLLCNFVLGSVLFYTAIHQRIEITPFFGGVGYIKSGAEVDAPYLDLMSENFVYSRLNVTPDTVKKNHERLMRYVSSQYTAGMKLILDREANYIIKKKISSVFNIESMSSNPNKLITDVCGTLKRYVGVVGVDDIKACYQMTYQYRFGQLSIQSFREKKGS